MLDLRGVNLGERSGAAQVIASPDLRSSFFSLSGLAFLLSLFS